MKTRFRVECGACGEKTQVETHTADNSVAFKCDSCGAEISIFPERSGISIGWLLMHKSQHELEQLDDPNTSIIFAACALECEMAYRHGRWTSLKAYMEDGTKLSDRILEEAFEREGNFRDKLRATGKLIWETGLDGFIKESTRWSKYISDSPVLNLREIFSTIDKAVCWPRNSLVHRGTIRHSKEDAVKVRSIVAAVLTLFDEMDVARSKTFVEEPRVAPTNPSA